MTKDEALRLALEALYGFIPYLPLEYDKPQCDRYDEAITAIKAALEANDEPIMEYPNYVQGVGWRNVTPPQRPWVGLTDEEIVLIVAECAASHQHTDIHFARAIEAKLKEKNNA